MYGPLLMPELRELLDEGDASALRDFCEALHPAAVAEVLEELDAQQTWQVLSASERELQVELLKFLSLPRQVEIVQTIDREELSQLVERMAPDDRVDLLERMDPDVVENLLPLIAQAERSDIRKLLSYEEESAGSIMTTEYASLPEDITAAEAIDRLRKQAPARETIYYVYILDEDRHLRGFVSLRELILARPTARLGDVMRKDVISVRVDDDQEHVSQELAKYDFIAIPVVDNQNRLVGIVTHDDVLDILQEEATEDAQRMGAVEPLEDSYLESSIRTIIRKRAIWLLFLGIVSLVTASTLKHFSKVNETHVWLVLFLPLVLASGGNVGSQSATLVIRALATEELSRPQNTRLIWREALLGAGLAACMSALGITAAHLVFGQTIVESTVVAGTVFLVVVMGSTAGAVLPLTFKNLGMDPAIMSTPLIAAIVDVLGVVIYYSVALTLL